MPARAATSSANGSTWTDTEQQKDVTIEPGASVAYERSFVVGERPDVASLVATMARAAGAETGTVEIALTDARGAPVATPPGAQVVLGTETEPEVLSIVAPDGAPRLRGDVPAGHWLVGYAPSAGRRGDGKRVAIDVRRDRGAHVSLSVTDASAIALGPCEEAAAGGTARSSPIPCKLTIEGIGESPTPSLGPVHTAGLARNVVTLRPRETASVPLPAGRYRITASRGPEYELASIEVGVPAPAAPPPFVLHRVLDTTGYVAGDFHQHTILSADSAVATRDRVLANAAEGVEIAVASEHNVVADLMPVVRELGLVGHVVEIAGDEITTDASKVPVGHANVYPLLAQAEKPHSGAPPARDRLAKDVFSEARGLPGGPHVLQINHPRSGKTGYFDQLLFDPKTGAGTGPGYDPVFDAIEVWNGRSVSQRTRVLEDVFALLRTGHVVTPIANTDTHGVVNEEPGYPRTWVRLPSPLADAPLDGWDAARSAALTQALTGTRDVVLSNGPFLQALANGAPIGSVVRAHAGGVVEVAVTVTTAPWVVVERVELRLARGKAPPAASLAFTRTPSGAMEAKASFVVRAPADDALVVIASGTKGMRPVLASAEESEIAPWAMTAPIWIDADGDGQSLGRRNR